MNLFLRQVAIVVIRIVLACMNQDPPKTVSAVVVLIHRAMAVLRLVVVSRGVIVVIRVVTPDKDVKWGYAKVSHVVREHIVNVILSKVSSLGGMPERDLS